MCEMKYKFGQKNEFRIMRHFVLLVLEKALEVKLRTIFVIQISLEIENALIY